MVIVSSVTAEDHEDTNGAQENVFEPRIIIHEDCKVADVGKVATDDALNVFTM